MRLNYLLETSNQRKHLNSTMDTTLDRSQARWSLLPYPPGEQVSSRLHVLQSFTNKNCDSKMDIPLTALKADDLHQY